MGVLEFGFIVCAIAVGLMFTTAIVAVVFAHITKGK